jgi:hypothetical protein
VPIVSHHHHLDPSPLNSVIERRVIEGSERVITVSSSHGASSWRPLGIARDRIEVVPNGIDERFAPGEGLVRRHRLGWAMDRSRCSRRALSRKNCPALLRP